MQQIKINICGVANEFYLGRLEEVLVVFCYICWNMKCQTILYRPDGTSMR